MIKGISDVRRLPRLGKIRLGEKKKNDKGKEYPSKLDHFNFKDAPGVAEIYGENCKELDIVLPSEDRDVFFSQERKAYRATGLFCKCADGDTAVRVRVGQADGSNPKIAKGTVLDHEGEAFLKEQGLECAVGDMFEMPCPGEECSFTDKKFCKPIGRLIFMLPKVKQFGCYEISTTSFNSMVTVNSYIEAVKNAAGRVSMIPLKLKLVPKQVQVEGKATGIFHLALVYEGTVESLMAYQKGVKLLPAPMPAAAIPTAAELDRHVPDDLVPHAGAALDARLGTSPSGPTPAEAIKAKMAVVAPKALPAPTAPAPAQPAPEKSQDPLDDEYVAGEDRDEVPQAPAKPAKAAAPATVAPKRF